MIKIIDGNLLSANTNIIAHQVNCKGAFNSGVAKTIREHDIQIFNDYHAYCKGKNPEELIGDVRYFMSDIDGKIYASLFAQKSYGYDGKQYTDLEALERCFIQLRDYALFESSNPMSIAMPYKIGSVRGGANWDDVFELIRGVFVEVDVELWRLDRG